MFLCLFFCFFVLLLLWSGEEWSCSVCQSRPPHSVIRLVSGITVKCLTFFSRVFCWLHILWLHLKGSFLVVFVSGVAAKFLILGTSSNFIYIIHFAFFLVIKSYCLRYWVNVTWKWPTRKPQLLVSHFFCRCCSFCVLVGSIM